MTRILEQYRLLGYCRYTVRNSMRKLITKYKQESQIRQVAASAQQDEIVRYLGELNDWLSRDAIDRRAELRGLGDRLDGIQRTMMYGPTPGEEIEWRV
jgi:hypothetical protein